jgi:uncharacterized membrane protein
VVGSFSAIIAYSIILVLNLFTNPESVVGSPKTTVLSVVSVISIGYMTGTIFGKFNNYSEGGEESL